MHIMDRSRIDYRSMRPEIPPGNSSEQLRSWTSFRHVHPVPRKRPQLEALHHLPKNTLTCAHRRTTSATPIPTITPTQKRESPARNAATWKLSTSRCRSLNGRAVELISPVTRCFCIACLDRQCRSPTSTACKARTTMAVDLSTFDKNCPSKYTHGRVSTTGNEPNFGNYLCSGLTWELSCFSKIPKYDKPLFAQDL